MLQTEQSVVQKCRPRHRSRRCVLTGSPECSQLGRDMQNTAGSGPGSLNPRFLAPRLRVVHLSSIGTAVHLSNNLELKHLGENNSGVGQNKFPSCWRSGIHSDILLYLTSELSLNPQLRQRRRSGRWRRFFNLYCIVILLRLSVGLRTVSHGDC